MHNIRFHKNGNHQEDHDIANHTDQNRTKELYITRKVSLYSVYTSTVFNGVYTEEGKVD